MKVVCPHCNTEFVVKKPKKSYLGGERDPFSKLIKIVNCLKKHDDWIWIRRIAKETSIKPFSVSYLIDKYLGAYVEILEPSAVYDTSGLRLKMYRLNNREIEPQKIVDDIKLRSKK